MSKFRSALVFLFFLFSLLSSSVYSSSAEELDAILLGTQPKTPVTAGNLGPKQETRVDFLTREAISDDLPKKAAAWMQLAEIYADNSEENPDYDLNRAFEIYDELLQDTETLPFVGGFYAVKFNMARVMLHHLNDETAALVIFNEIIEKREEVESWVYELSLQESFLWLANIHRSVEQQKKGLALAEMARRDASLVGRDVRLNALYRLGYAYQFGPEGIQDYEKAATCKNEELHQTSCLERQVELWRDLLHIELGKETPDFGDIDWSAEKIMTHHAFSSWAIPSLTHCLWGSPEKEQLAIRFLDTILVCEPDESRTLGELAYRLQYSKHVSNPVQAKETLFRLLQLAPEGSDLKTETLMNLSCLFHVHRKDVTTIPEAVSMFTNVIQLAPASLDEILDASYKRGIVCAYENLLGIAEALESPERRARYPDVELDFTHIARDYINFLGNPLNGVENPERVRELEVMLGLTEEKSN